MRGAHGRTTSSYADAIRFETHVESAEESHARDGPHLHVLIGLKADVVRSSSLSVRLHVGEDQSSHESGSHGECGVGTVVRHAVHDGGGRGRAPSTSAARENKDAEKRPREEERKEAGDTATRHALPWPRTPDVCVATLDAACSQRTALRRSVVYPTALSR